MIIKKIKAKRIWNSRREPAIEISVNKWKASTPSGASKGENEVLTFPEQGVEYAVNLINKEYREKLLGLEINDFNDLKQVEDILKISEVGGNTVLAFEYGCLRALSRGDIYKLFKGCKGVMPMPLGNVVGGGAHFKEKSIDIQEILLLPRAKTFKEGAFANQYIHKQVGKRLKTKKQTDEGAWAPDVSNLEALDVVKGVVKELGKKFGFKIDIGVDMAASSLFKNNGYVYRDGKLNRARQIKFVLELVKKYGLKYVEDPLEQNDMKGFSLLNKKVSNCLICGDDLLCTNTRLVEEAIDKKAVSAAIVKPNQNGSLLKTYEVVGMLKKNSIVPVVSHRSGETYDSTISDLAVGFNAPIIKCGISGKVRQAKINRLNKIEKSVKS